MRSRHGRAAVIGSRRGPRYTVDAAMAKTTSFRSDEHFTRAQFVRWLDGLPSSDVNRYELLRGQIVMCPPAVWMHGTIEANLIRHLGEHVIANDLGTVFGSSTGIDLPSGDTVQPDCSYVSHERLCDQPREPAKLFLKVVPELIVEILSDSTARRDRTEKKALYEQSGVDEYWLVDPVRKRVTIFAHSATGYGAGVVYTDGTLRSPLLPGLRLALATLFRSPLAVRKR
jgi:Uma2 family endonuclease